MTTKTAVVRTTSMAPSGEAVAHLEEGGERRALLVRGGAPDEVARVRFDPSSRPARAEIVELVEPSRARVAPPCPYVDACGGCDWMHLSREAQRAAHVALAERVAKGAPIAFHAAERPLAYRTRARLHARRGKVGFFGARTHTIVAPDACAVLEPRAETARAAIVGLLSGARGEGEVSVALGRGGLPVADVAWSDEFAPTIFSRLEAEVAAKRWAGFRVTIGEARKPAVVGDPTPFIEAADGAPLELAPGGFSQANEPVNRALATRVAALASEAKKVVELYAGAGNFTVLLARAATVRAVESHEAACEAARRNLAARSLEAKVTCADAATFELPGGTDLVVLDPPRTGARDACDRLARAKSVRRVVYVSCDRATLERDAAILAERYDVASIDLFEMFPSTSHVETVAAFERRRNVVAAFDRRRR